MYCAASTPQGVLAQLRREQGGKVRSSTVLAPADSFGRVKDLKAKFGGDRAADRKVMEALDELVHDTVVCQKSGVFFTARSGRAEKALPCKVVKLGKNFAFVMLEDESGDIFIPGRFTRGAMPGDSVLGE